MNSEIQPTKICMLDIETLDTTPQAKILSLGAVDVYGLDTYYVEFDHYQYGRTASESTRLWWVEQCISQPNGNIDLKKGLMDFAEWYQAKGFTEVWCKGSDFDFVILSDAYLAITKGKAPWEYHQVRDLRTLIKVFPEIEAPLPYKTHNALTDAICQAAHLKEILNHVERIEQICTRQFIEANLRSITSN
jgi:DNA polymerase III epsilon subunit-like protein